MKALHLNLLKESERLSSSPVRIRVMLPVAALLACAGMLVWWGVTFGQTMIAVSKTETLKDDIARNEKAYAETRKELALANELEAELEQLGYYRASRCVRGPLLTSLAEAMPLKVQLVKITLPPPPPQILTDPKKPKLPPLWGTTNLTEEAVITLFGRAPKETPVIAMMEALEGDAFTNSLYIVKDPHSPLQSPKVRSFKQDTPKAGESGRMLSFEIEYRAKERRFAL